METKIVKRGYVPTDAQEFGTTALPRLHDASLDINYLLERGYPIGPAVTFTGNHYQLSERQRTALTRSLCTSREREARKAKELTSVSGQLQLDGFNTIITLEVALSGSLLLDAADGTIRDIAGLHGSFRIVDKTVQAIDLILAELAQLQISEAVFWLDEPVSNSGRLKTLLGQKSAAYPFAVQINLCREVDKRLFQQHRVVTSDSVVLDNCLSWYNLNRRIIERRLPQAWLLKV